MISSTPSSLQAPGRARFGGNWALTLALLILGAYSAAAQIVVTNVTTVNVTLGGFSVVGAVSPAITPSMTASISVFADAGGVTNLAGQVGIEYYPLHTGDPTLTNAYDRLVGEAALRQQTMGLGLFYARVSDCSPGTAYFYLVAVSNTNGQTTLFPASGPLPSVTTARETSFVLDSEQLIVTLNDSSPAGAILTLSNTNTPSVLAAVVGDGAGANQAFFSLNDFIAAAGGTNYLPVGNQQFTAHVLGLSPQGLSKTYTVAFSTNFSVGSATPEVLGGGSATTLAASAITAGSATLNASVNPNGAPTTVYFEWGATTNYGSVTSSDVLSANLNTAQPVALGIGGLLPGATIHFQVVAVNSAGTSYGGDLTLVTPALPPTDVTLPASGITPTNATLNSSVTPNGAPTAVFFRWGATTNYGNFTATNTISSKLSSARAVAMPIGGLTPGATNHFQIVAVNNSGTAYGADLTVVTLPLPPLAVTWAASGITPTNATLNASVTPNGAPTAVFFQWGATINYGNFTAANTLSANLSTAQAVSALISNLLPGTTNHFQAAASNSAGTSYGADLTVVTPSQPPIAVTLAASGITPTNATLNASVTPNGAPTAVFFQWGATTNYGNFTAANTLSASFYTAQAVALVISNLLPGTTNHFQAAASNSAGTSYGADLTVVTPSQPPIAVTLAASGVTLTNATLNASVTPNGAPATVFFRWGATTNYGNFTATNIISSKLSSARAVAMTIGGLAPGTTNHFQVVASNSAGTSYGADLTLVTTLQPPLAVTLAATGVTSNSVVLNGSVNPNGAVTTVYFQWGGSASYGNFTATNTIPSGYSVVFVSNGISGLAPLTLYHYQVIAANSAGTNYGADQTVLTPLPPVAVTSPGAITNAATTFKAVVTPNGAPTTSWFEWGTTIAYGNATQPASVGASLSANSFSSLQTGFPPGIVYHYRAVATNYLGRANGADALLESAVISLNGANPLTNQCHSPFVDPGVHLVSAAPLAIAAASGGAFSLALKADGTVAGWGQNTYRQATPPLNVSNVLAVSAGQDFGLALVTGGTVRGWGWNGQGQITIPSSLTNAVGIAAGLDFGLAVKTDGTVAAWGDSSDGALSVPASLTNAVSAAAGGFGVALTRNGTVTGWGDDSYGETIIPANLTNVVSVAAGIYHGLALNGDGTVVAWGQDYYGQTDVPSGLSNVIAIAAGSYHNLALRANGTVAAWGDDSYGEADVPANLTNVVAVAASDFHSLALQSGGAVIAWGDNSLGELNVPATLTNLNVSVAVLNPVDTNTPDAYALSYAVIDFLGGVGTTNRSVEVVDTLPPVLTLLGANPFTNLLNTPWVDPGASAMDACAGNLTAGIVTNGAVNTSVAGSYVLTYSVADPSGNTAVTNRLVIVSTSAPMFQQATVASHAITFTWSSVAGATYQVQYKNNLNQPAWSNLAAPVVAGGATVSASDGITNTDRFYRIVQLP